MEIRKLQLTGGSSIAITLPKAWVERTGLRAGDAVGCVARQDGTLLVTPKPTRKPAVQTLELELGPESSEHLFRRLVGAYLNGYDIIQLHSKTAMTAEQRATVRKAVRRAIGLEVVDEGPRGITIQDFLDPTEFPLEKGVRRMAAIAQAMYAEAVAGLGGTLSVDAGLEERDSEVDRLYWLINKQYHSLLRDARLAESLGLSPSQALNFLLVARLIERTADHAQRIGENVAELQGVKADAALVRKVQRMSDDSLAIFQDAMTAFFKRDPKLANDAIDRAGRVHAAKRALVHDVMDLRGPPAVALAYILESVERTASYGSDIAEIAINHVVAAAAGE
ncbi:MAG TPA: PhoU domain-containing protein [Candidatus Thermoplasmatota archaeon]|jgi:phosphate uptake regulator|nr:PhoU domain-containing protein [Candidatus Thermoplasmatota archaeon]